MKRLNWFSPIAAACILTLGGLGYRAYGQQGEQQAEKPMMQCPMMQTMKSIEMHATSPDLLVARAEQLDLSEEQQKKLRDISKRAREQAQQVLNDGQRKKLEEGKSGPLTPMELVKLVAKERKQGTRSAENKMMCPMCKKMMNKKMANKEGHDE